MAPIPDPHPLYARLRAEAPVLRLPRPDKSFFLVTRFADARHVLKTDRVFSNRANARLVGMVMGPTLIQMDGREHDRHRKLVTPALAPRALRGSFPALVERLAQREIDRFASRREADLSGEFAFYFPLRVFVEILGLPAEEVEQFHRWAIDLTHIAKDPGRGFEGSRQLGAYLLPVVQRRRAQPEGPDLVSRLCHAKVEGQELSDEEVVSFLRLLVIAGAETTYHLLGTALHVLLHEPALLSRVRADRGLLEPLLWEALRWESPISTLPREALEDVELAGVEIPAGSDILVHVGSANRDSARFAAADHFDIERNDRDHLGFGMGRHYCAGSRLAILEARIGLGALLDRLTNLRLAPGRDSRIIGFSFRGPDQLPVVFDPVH